MYVIVGTVQDGNHRETWISPNSPFETLKEAIKAVEEDVKYEKSIGAQIHYWNCFTRDDATFTYTIRELGEAYVRENEEKPKSKYTSPVKFSSTDNYGSGPGNEDDVYTVEEFVRHCRDGSFIDDDGHGHPVKDNMADESYTVYPSEYLFIPKDATHIVWYNK